MSDDLFDLKKPKTHLTPALSPGGEGGDVRTPATLDYVPEGGGRWRIEKFELLVAELPVEKLVDTSPRPSPPAERERATDWARAARLFHEMVSRANARWWTIVRRLYGIAPLVPPSDADINDLCSWKREALCEVMGIEVKQLQAELDTLRGVMLATADSQNSETQKTGELEPVAKFDEAGEGRLVFDVDVLKRYGYAEAMFNLRTRTLLTPGDKENAAVYGFTDRDSELNRMERDWFAQRVQQWHRLLDEPMTAALARQTLFNELQIRRIEDEMSNLPPTAAAYDDLSKRRAAIEKAFTDQLTALEERFPEFGGTSGRVSFKACVHDIIKSCVEYRARGDARLMDRVRSALELEVDFRQSRQSPEPGYRLGQTVYIGEAIAGLFDPAWRSQLKPAVLAKLDRGMKEGINKAREERGEVLVDLEADGVASEYGALVDVGGMNDQGPMTKVQEMKRKT